MLKIPKIFYLVYLKTDLVVLITYWKKPHVLKTHLTWLNLTSHKIIFSSCVLKISQIFYFNQ